MFYISVHEVKRGIQWSEKEEKKTIKVGSI